MAVVVMTYWETNENTGRKELYIDYGYDEKTDKIIIMSPEPVAECDYIKWDVDSQCYLLK